MNLSRRSQPILAARPRPLAAMGLLFNNRKDWGFLFRITDPQGSPVDGLRISLEP